MRYIFHSLIFLVACNSSQKQDQSSLAEVSNTHAANNSGLNLPQGFKAEVFAEVDNARSLAVSPAGVVYVGNRSGDKVYALHDADNDGIAEEKYVIAQGLNSPNGVAFKDGDLYVAEISRILKFKNIEADLSNPPKYEVVYDQYPTEGHHGWKYIAFGPDGKLYVPVGAPCNICESGNEIYASLTRLNTDGSGREIVAHGIRNTVGFDWDESGVLWFTDNGRDMMGDNYPPCELNKITKQGQHFGYPYCHGGDIADPEFGSLRSCSEFVKPMHNFKAHTAPLGMHFYQGDMFPSAYRGDIFVAQHGSWNRSSKVGYRVMRMHVSNGKVDKAEVFMDGWLNDATQDVTGRPVDVVELKDGSLLVSDDYGNKIYRITYEQSN